MGKHQVYARLAEVEERLYAAGPDSLDWAFWNQVLELVEQLPRREQTAWKSDHMPALRRVVREVDEVSR